MAWGVGENPLKLDSCFCAKLAGSLVGIAGKPERLQAFICSES